MREFKKGEEYRVVGEPKRHYGGTERLLDRVDSALVPPAGTIVTVRRSGLDPDGDVLVKWDGCTNGYILPENLAPVDDEPAVEVPEEWAQIEATGLSVRRCAALGFARETLVSSILSGPTTATELIALADWLLAGEAA